MQDLGQVVVVDHGERQHDLAARGRRAHEQVVLGPDQGAERRDQLLADRVQRGVGHLGEELGEVVEHQPWPVRQRGDRAVGSHRADRLGPGAGHGGDQHPQLLLGVAEGLLPAYDGLVGVHDVLALGQVLQVQDARVQPLVVREGGGQRGLDLLVLDDPAADRVDEEHPARLQPTLADHRGRVDVEHADLAGEDDQPVVGDPEPAGTQAVAVQHCADDRAVGEGDARRPVPRLHQRGVELVERPAGGIHPAVVLPGLRDHHQDRVRQRATTEVEQLEDLVERDRVARAVRTDREEPVEVAGDQIARQLRLAGPHPVAVALDRVDLAVVRDVAVRVRQRPGREGVGREARVHQCQRADHPAVGQVGEERLELTGRQHALVDDRARGQGREVDVGLALGPLAQAEGHPLELQPGDATAGRPDEELAEQRLDGTGGGTDQARVDGEVTPAEDVQALLASDGRDRRLDRGQSFGRRRGRQERDADGVLAGRREHEVDHGAEERVRDLDQDAGAVAGVGVGAGRAAVLEVAQSRQRQVDDLVAGLAGQGRDERDAARVVLVACVVETLRGRNVAWCSGHVNSPSSSLNVLMVRDDSGPAALRTVTRAKRAVPTCSRGSAWVDVHLRPRTGSCGAPPC